MRANTAGSQVRIAGRLIDRNGGQPSIIGRLAARGHTLVTPALLSVVLASQVLEMVGRVGIEPTTN